MNHDDYKFSQYEQNHSSTRWARASEIKSTTNKIKLGERTDGLAGLPMINDGETAYVDALDNHSLVFGSTGSKKTRLFCMPTLRIMIDAGESFIVTDPKAELYEMSSGAASANGYNVIVLNYRDLSKGDSWNPLAMPYKLYQSGDKDSAIARINDFVNAISEKLVNNTRDIFWVNAAKSVALAVLITMLDCCTEEECNLKTFTRFCVDFSKGTSDKLMVKAMNLDEDDIETNYLEEVMSLAASDSIARLNFDGIFSSSDRAKGDVQSTLFTLIAIFLSQETLVRNMAQNSFDIDKISKEKTALYLIVPDERTNYHFIATTFIKQCYESLILNAQLEDNKQLPIRVNFLLDEFANIPKIPDMPSMISAGRSRNIRFFLILQSMHQLREKYKNDAETIKGNCENWVFLASKELSLLEEISKLAGTVDKNIGGTLRSVPLISISQLQRLNKQSGEALIFCARHYPFITKMTDIANCNFPYYPAFKEKNAADYKVISINAQELLEEFDKNKRNLPFKNITKKGFDAKAVETEIRPILHTGTETIDNELATEDNIFFDKIKYRPYIVAGDYCVLENDDKELLFAVTAKIEKVPSNPVFYTSGDDIGFLLSDDGIVVIYDYINSKVCDKIPKCEKVLCVFASSQNLLNRGTEIYSEFEAEVKYIKNASSIARKFLEHDTRYKDDGVERDILFHKLYKNGVIFGNYYVIEVMGDNSIEIQVERDLEEYPTEAVLYTGGGKNAILESYGLPHFICEELDEEASKLIYEACEVDFVFSNNLDIKSKFTAPVIRRDNTDKIVENYLNTL